MEEKNRRRAGSTVYIKKKKKKNRRGQNREKCGWGAYIPGIHRGLAVIARGWALTREWALSRYCKYSRDVGLIVCSYSLHISFALIVLECILQVFRSIS